MPVKCHKDGREDENHLRLSEHWIFFIERIIT